MMLFTDTSDIKYSAALAKLEWEVSGLLQIKNMFGETHSPASGYYQLIKKLLESLDASFKVDHYFKALRITYWGGKAPIQDRKIHDIWQFSQQPLSSTNRAAADLVADSQLVFSRLRYSESFSIGDMLDSFASFEYALDIENRENHSNFCPDDSLQFYATATNFESLVEEIEEDIEDALADSSEELIEKIALFSFFTRSLPQLSGEALECAS